MKRKKPNWTKTRQSLEYERCRRSAQYFIFDGARLVTKDEHDPTHPIKPFPASLYLRSLLDLFLVSGRLCHPDEAGYAREAGHGREFLGACRDAGMVAVEKSRQVMVTWLVCAYLLWRAKFRPHQLLLLQSKREEDACNLVFVKEPYVARMSFMESHLPAHLRHCQFPKAGTYGHLYFPNGSHAWGIPEGGDIIRSNTPSVIFSDESAFQPQFGLSYTAALPAIKGGGQYICVSSAEPGEFQQLVEAA